MEEPLGSTRRYGMPARGTRQSDVSHAADALLRAGDRPSVEKVRAKLGGGSPNTINPMLDAWWKTLGVRLDSGPAALHRLPESVTHIAEALWMQALEESRRRVLLEQRSSDRVAELDKERLEFRSHVLSLREGEMESRVHDRDRRIAELNRQITALTSMLQKEQATCDSMSRQLTANQADRLAARQITARIAKAANPRTKDRQSAAKTRRRSKPPPKRKQPRAVLIRKKRRR